ncbi:N-acetylmuramoyl-L-alanine amidase [Prauserella muralis]|nr:N-acetylmuramoyl-L-alanine amidase [Prauserella muralis]
MSASRVDRTTLADQVRRARVEWPFVDAVEVDHGLPVGLLYAVGSRETNLRNVRGDGGHGWGVWQRDDRYWPVGPAYLADVRRQAVDAASLLAANRRALGGWPAAVAAYNAGPSRVRQALAEGRGVDYYTTGRDYSADVLARRSIIETLGETTVQIIPRARWGARHDNGFTAAPLPAEEVWLHHSVTLAPDIQWIDADRDGVDDDEERAMRTLEGIGEDRFGGGISYTFLIPPSGRIYEGHGVGRQGSHTGGRNDRARAICFIGNYETHRPTQAQIAAAAWLLRHGKAQGWWRHARLNGGHRDLKATACPGQHAYAAIPAINKLAAQPGGGGAAPGGGSTVSKADVVDGLEQYFERERHEPTQRGDQPDMNLRGSIIHTHEYALGAYQNSGAIRQEMAGLRAALDKLADAVAAGGGSSAAELKQAVADAIRENIVQVDVTVAGGSEEV